LRDAIERAPNRLERYANVVDQVGRLFGGASWISIRAGSNQLGAFFADFFQTQIAVEKQLARVASPVWRVRGLRLHVSRGLRL
jgi:hypothetical protein